MWLLRPPKRIERTQKASPAAIKFHFAETLNVASANRTNENTRRIRLIMVFYFLISTFNFLLYAVTATG